MPRTRQINPEEMTKFARFTAGASQELARRFYPDRKLDPRFRRIALDAEKHPGRSPEEIEKMTLEGKPLNEHEQAFHVYYERNRLLAEKQGTKITSKWRDSVVKFFHKAVLRTALPLAVGVAWAMHPVAGAEYRAAVEDLRAGAVAAQQEGGKKITVAESWTSGNDRIGRLEVAGHVYSLLRDNPRSLFLVRTPEEAYAQTAKLIERGYKKAGGTGSVGESLFTTPAIRIPDSMESPWGKVDLKGLQEVSKPLTEFLEEHNKGVGKLNVAERMAEEGVGRFAPIARADPAAGAVAGVGTYAIVLAALAARRASLSGRQRYKLVIETLRELKAKEARGEK